MMSLYSPRAFTEGSGNTKLNGLSSVVVDKTKEWQMELLMEKLRSKRGQFKTFAESAKALRMSLLEKRYPVDNIERNQLQKCLDTLQQSIKVTSLQGMVERLESVTRQLGLKFMAGPTGLDWFISSDMFYLEVVLESTGSVKDVKIHHEGKVEQQSCEELVACLSRGDFSDFTVQLEGLASIYQLNAEKKVKCKAFSALQSLESDLGTLAQIQTLQIIEPFNLVHKSPVGILQKRRGGHAMQLTYLVPPYDLLDLQTRSALPLSVELVTSRKLGYSVSVCMEGSAAHKLPIAPLITVSRNTSGKSSPVYAPLTATNSATLPACFALRLSQPMPVCLPLVRRLQQLTELDCGDVSSPHPLLSLVVQHASAGKLDCASNRGLFVSLPDQQHCYFLTEQRGLDAVLVSSVPFTHPTHVPQILVCLRQQALFNELVASCVRPAARHDLEAVMFEVTALSWQRLSISFEHPLEETMTTAELDLTDIANVRCRVYGSGSEGTAPEHVSKVLQRSLSIPVTMRALIRSWESEARSAGPPSIGLPGGDVGRQGGLGGNSGPDLEVTRPESNQGAGLVEGSEGSAFQLGSLLGETRRRKRRAGDTVWRSPKRAVHDDCEIVVESSSSDSGAAEDCDGEEEVLELSDAWRPRKEKKSSPPTIILDLADNKSLVPPSVSITPIPAAPSFNSVLTGMGLERRPGIEIIPIVSAPAAALPSSITITPISSKSEDRGRDRKAGKGRTEEKRGDKKRKRRREDSPTMGPPKQDPLSKPVSVSIKPAESPGSPSTRSLPLTNKGTGTKPAPTQSPKHSPGYATSSPKQHGTSSPKHQSSGGSQGKPSMSALKSAASSPAKGDTPKAKSSSSSKDKDRKASFGGVSGSSPKLKSSSVKLKQLDLSSTAEGGSGSGGGTPPSDGSKSATPQARNRKGSLSAVIDKLKSAQHCGPEPAPGGKTAPDASRNPAEYMVKPSSDGMKITINKTRTKDSKSGAAKGSSSSSGSGSPKTHTGLKPGVNSGPASKKPHPVVQQKSSSGKAGNTSKGLSATKSGSSPAQGLVSKSSKSSGSPKMLDASRRDKLRPSKGVDRDKSVFSSSKGPDARKASPVALRDESEGERAFKLLAAHAKMEPTLPPQLMVEGLMKSLDTKFQIPKLSARSNAADSESKKPNADKVLSGESSRTDSSAKPIDLVGKADGSASSSSSSTTTTKFPILSKSTDDSNSSKTASANVSSSFSVGSNQVSIKSLSSSNLKPLIPPPPSAGSKPVDTVNLEAPLIAPPNVATSADDATDNRKGEDVSGVTKAEPSGTALSLVLPNKTADETKKIADVPATPQEAAEMLLDFSASSLPSKPSAPELKLTTVPERALASGRRNTPPPPPPPPPAFPSSPSVSVHIVKSPAPSPLVVIPSPHSGSPCITDDELMDEALVGMGK